jgi:uncharacterized protein (DUF1501 family)
MNQDSVNNVSRRGFIGAATAAPLALAQRGAAQTASRTVDQALGFRHHT